MSEWKPIETAPKNGSGFIYFQPEGNLWIIDSGYFDGANYRNVNFFGGEEAYIEPTHWMPLPKPPTHNPEKEE